MKRFNSYHAINVFSFTFHKWRLGLHKHNFYELIFIEAGTGRHIINEISFLYKTGDVFFLAPDDAHEFVIEQKTTFTYVQFTEQAFWEKLGNTSQKNMWEQALRNVLTRQKIGNGNILETQEEKQHAFILAQMLKTSFEKRPLYYQEEISMLFCSLMMIVVRNLQQKEGLVSSSHGQQQEKLNNLLSYIRLNVLDPDKTSIKNLAAHFLMSPHYISIYIKKHTGISIKQHILQVKLKQAEILLQQGRWNVNEISEKLGFNDASHFNKMFKKYKSITPSKLKITSTSPSPE